MPIMAEEMMSDYTLKSCCGHCSKNFTKDLRKTRRFLVIGTAGCTENVEEGQRTVEIWQGVEEILGWRYGKTKFVDTMDKNLALCSNCGIMIAKLYSVIQLFEQSMSETVGYISKRIAAVLDTKTKGTDTTLDVVEHEDQEVPMVPEDGYADFQDVVDHCEAQDIMSSSIYYEESEYRADTDSGVIKDNAGKEFLCHLCPAGFDKLTNLKRHLLLTHDIGDREKNFTCHTCGKAYYFSHLLKQHEKCHSENRPLACPHEGCSSTFKRQNGLYHHLRETHELGRYKCSFCVKRYKQRQSLVYHEEHKHYITKGMQHWTCEFCKAKFKHKLGFLSHREKCARNPNRIKTPPPTNENETAVHGIIEEVAMEFYGEINIS